MTLPQLSEEEIRRFIAQATEFIANERERFAGRAERLSGAQREAVAGFFSEELLDGARVIVLEEETVANPDFVPELRGRGFDSVFDLNHLNAVPFGDVIVYHETINKRLLFHGLVHLVQQRAMGMGEWVERYVRGLLRTGLHVTIPIEVHAYELDGRFALTPRQPFSVEDEVKSWIEARRYS